MIKSASLAVAVAAAATLAIWSVAGERADAHTGAMGVVKERMELMSSLAEAMKAIKVGVTAKPEMQRDAIAAAAKQITAHADRLPNLFPKGSDSHPSEVRPEVWQSWQEFTKANDAMKMEATKLADVAQKADRGAVLGQFARTARSCGGCHEAFRKKKN